MLSRTFLFEEQLLRHCSENLSKVKTEIVCVVQQIIIQNNFNVL